MKRHQIDADHAATTRTAPEVERAMSPYFGERFGNPSSVHSRGEAAHAALDTARRQVAALLHGTAEAVVFTAGGSEANNLALKGVLWAARGDRRRLVISAIEHPSVIETARHLEAHGTPLTVIPVERSGLVDPDRLSAALGSDVALVSVMWVNNEIGTIQPVAELARRAHAAGARFHCDAVQAAGKLAIDVGEAEVDLLSVAAHKFHGPPGAGALWVRRGLKLVPLVHGGRQERGRRAGTENLPALVGFGAAAERAAHLLSSGEGASAQALGERLLARLAAALPGLALNGDRRQRLASILNVRLPGVDGEAALHELDGEGILVSTGSACSAASPGPSHVLLALGLSAEDAHASVRFSLGEDNREADVDTIVNVMPGIVERLRSLAGGGAAQQR
jgi:cysteine desulfurase